MVVKLSDRVSKRQDKTSKRTAEDLCKAVAQYTLSLRDVVSSVLVPQKCEKMNICREDGGGGVLKGHVIDS